MAAPSNRDGATDWNEDRTSERDKGWAYQWAAGWLWPDWADVPATSERDGTPASYTVTDEDSNRDP